ncbi:helix-turn-helix domain-containing protein [Bradyrhizobium manausense]|uniref:helix-turn-helix domain-containing protein n=1 Tax=Bradyrhizobium manausense TaxID=989370 RepID=UPI001BA930E3|nr:helix-turn-helix domain-containing protein [Bradyrhizobium manausense]MBR1091338.1 helix-turn-helix domain-containing protein [Bradyrhizobium manausense]
MPLTKITGEKAGEQKTVAPFIPRSVFDLTQLPPKDAVAAWQEALGSMYDIRLHNDGPNEPLRIRTKAYHFDSFILGALQVRVKQDVARSRARYARDGLDSYTLHFHSRECVASPANGSQQRIQCGDLLILDQAQTSSSRLNGQDDLYMVVPRAMLAPLLNAPDEHNARVISGKNPLVALFRSHLHALYRASSDLQAQAACAVTHPTLELAAAAINESVREENSIGPQMALAAEICRHIDDRAMEPGLTAEKIAAAFNMSERKLYYLMRVHGGVAAYILKVRLRRVRAALVDPVHRHKTIAEIAESYGFTDPTNFSRTFRRMFDMSPRAMRAFAGAGWPGEVSSRHGVGTMWDWMRHI